MLTAHDEAVRVLVLQGRPIDEPVVQHGPFVMNTREEIYQAFADYQRTEFGGWPWGASDVVHPRQQGRFAQMGDGSVHEPKPVVEPLEGYPVSYTHLTLPTICSV